MKNETFLEVKEKDGLLIHQGVIRVPYTWAAGETASRFYAGLKERKIYGVRCYKCGIILVPPKKVCHRCFGELKEWVNVSDSGTLQTFTIVRYSEPEIHPMKAPFAYGIIKLDGADTGMVHLIGEADLSELAEGMRMRAVFKEKPEGNYLDIKYFKPIKGAKNG
ncbi:MAG: Zn-ribbon domain-containing OB-fold protein [Chloroflexi bacterium]|nr:Zn-ribbon domain-containing OB-fold protein [Chloroflexota bacterium]